VYVRGHLAVEAAGEPSATEGYGLVVAALVAEDDEDAARCAASDAHDRTADAIAGLAAGDGEAFRAAVAEIVADFGARESHLTGVAIADTAAMLEAIARERGVAANIHGPLLPA
jgi:hypothetical protein